MSFESFFKGLRRAISMNNLEDVRRILFENLNLLDSCNDKLALKSTLMEYKLSAENTNCDQEII